jgi:dolichol-phosphate mannosyltransferase
MTILQTARLEWWYGSRQAEPRIHLLLRQNDRGFGTAVRDGFVEALRLGSPLVGEMDADGSHDPVTFPRMIEHLETAGADVVIGSRYVAGSEIRGWGPFRYLNSHVANCLARFATGVPVADATNGLRLFRREVLERICLPSQFSRGYSVILESNYRAHSVGFRLSEVPITFHPREAGTSKMGLREILRFCWFLLRLRVTGSIPNNKERPMSEAA